MSEFYNPYQFIPVTGKIDKNDTPTVAYEKIEKGEHAHIRHDCWVEAKKHGRIICQVHLKTPTVAGGLHEKVDANDANSPTRVLPYTDIENNIALPANSLRGMISSIAESLSQSSLRVLENRAYSVRKPMSGSVSALGILVKSTGEDRDFDLLPLTVPISTLYPPDKKWQNLFQLNKYPLIDFLPTYICEYKKEKATKHKKAKIYPMNGTFLSKNTNCSSFQQKQAEHYYYAQLDDKTEKVVGGFKLGNIRANNLISEDSWDQSKDDNGQPINQQNYTRGVLRILGHLGRTEELASTQKTYELFIPWDENKASPKPDPIPVPEQVIHNFCILADEQAKLTEKEKVTQIKRPFMPQGYDIWQVGDKPQIGDLVFFDIDEKAAVVSEISFSSIWRKPVTGSSHEFFGQIHDNLLPWNNDRNDLTPAECLFGVVEDKKREQDKTARALASRLRFSDAQQSNPQIYLKSDKNTITMMKDNQAINEVMLKILSSPKPPSPAMYFHPKTAMGRYVGKIDLHKDEHRPNGRKVYLHHQEQAIDAQFWKTNKTKENKKQKMLCTPIPKGEHFYFHIDFDNLSEAELSLLLHSLQPADQFQHRLGLGKSLGLGSVKLSIEGVFLINRSQRYGKNAFSQGRYHEIYSNHKDSKWSACYPVEATYVTADSQPIDTLRKKDQSLIDKESLDILATVGNPNKLKPNIPVQAPLAQGQNLEEEGFQWFVNNDNYKTPIHHQALKPIKAEQDLPTMQTNREPQKNRGHQR